MLFLSSEQRFTKQLPMNLLYQLWIEFQCLHKIILSIAESNL